MLKRLLAKFFRRSLEAFALIKKGERSIKMIKTLVYALDLFLENRLESVNAGPMPDPISCPPLRMKTRERILNEGDKAIYLEIIDGLILAIRNRILANPNFGTLRDLIRIGGKDGKHDINHLLRSIDEDGDLPSGRASKDLEERLAEYGLTTNMYAREVKALFSE